MALTDAINSYRLFLGREPESEQVAEKRAKMPLRNSLAGFIASHEFSENVLGALFDNGSLPHAAVSAFPAEDLKEWAGNALPLTDDTRAKIGQAKTWRHLVICVLLDTSFFEQIGRFAGSKIYARFRALHAGMGNFSVEREIAGGIDDVSTLEVRGWATNVFDPAEIIQAEILLDNILVGVAECGQFRPDVQAKLGGTGLHGFSFIIPAAHHHLLETDRLLTVRDSISRVSIARPLRINIGEANRLDSLVEVRHELATLAAALKRVEQRLPEAISRAAYPLALYDDYQREAQRTLAANRSALAAEAASLAARPLISVVIAGSNPNASGLSRSVASVKRQIYENWECIVCGQPPEAETERQSLIDGFTSSDARVRRVTAPADADGRVLMNALAGAAKGAYILTLTEGDTLGDDALFVIVRSLQTTPFRLAYFDEDVLELDAFRNITFRDPSLKPAFDYDYLLASDYIGSRVVFEKSLFDDIGGASDIFPAAFFFDLVLRMIERIDRATIRHIPRVLYHRVELADAPPVQDDARAKAEIDCLHAHFERVGFSGEAAPHEDTQGKDLAGCRRIAWKLREPAPKVSIIIPTRDRADLLQQCISSVLASQPEYPVPFEIIVVDNESVEPKTHTLFKELAKNSGVKIIPFTGGFNWSAINNAAARHATGEVLVFLNNDTVVLSGEWVREIASTLSRPQVGVVGTRLLYEDGTIQHAGVVIGVKGTSMHEGVGEPANDGGYMGRTALQRNVLAVTGACLATRASTFREFGGFDEANFKVIFSDIDYCLKVRDSGLAVIYTPFATLYHFESKSRGLAVTRAQALLDLAELKVFARRWRKYFDNDPYYNPHFDRFSRPFSRLQPVAIFDGAAPGDSDADLWREV